MTEANCPICVRPKSQPWRVYTASGKVLEGCVARFHDGANLVGESAFWHAEGRKRLGRARA